MADDTGLFGKIKQCEYCKRALPLHYEADYCPKCLDARLFNDVKDFIRSNTVNEYEVAAHFNIPLKQVKEWIREGRIEYRTDNSSNTISGMHCQRCGAPVTFGSLCPKCLKLLNSNKGLSSNGSPMADSKMRYLDVDSNSNSES